MDEILNEKLTEQFVFVQLISDLEQKYWCNILDGGILSKSSILGYFHPLKEILGYIHRRNGGGAPRHVPPLEKFWGGTAPPKKSIKRKKIYKKGKNL